VTPQTHYNAGWQLYSVDTSTFTIVNAKNFFANISNTADFPASGPEWEFENDARETYDTAGTWPKTAPLNATFWHDVTERMLSEVESSGNGTSGLGMVNTYISHEFKSSVEAQLCTDEACAVDTICLIRSGSAGIARGCAEGQGF
jgi:hypothetical protein